MGTTSEGLLVKYHNMKVTKCETQYNKTFRQAYYKTSLIQISITQNISKSNNSFGPLE